MITDIQYRKYCIMRLLRAAGVTFHVTSQRQAPSANFLLDLILASSASYPSLSWAVASAPRSKKCEWPPHFSLVVPEAMESSSTRGCFRFSWHICGGFYIVLENFRVSLRCKGRPLTHHLPVPLHRCRAREAWERFPVPDPSRHRCQWGLSGQRFALYSLGFVSCRHYTIEKKEAR